MGKWEKVGEGKYEIHREKKFDWEAIWGTIVLGIVVITVVANL